MTVASLFTRHRPLATRVARDFYLPGSEHQDVEQEALIGLWDAAQRFNGTGDFKAFAGMVIRRRLSSVLRAALAEKHRPLTRSVRVTRDDDTGEHVDYVEILPSTDDPVAVLLAREQWERLCVAARTLTPVEREALELAIAGEPYAQSKRLDNAAVRARRKLRAAA